MKIFMVGDYTTGTGPANVTKSYLRLLPQGTLKLNSKEKAKRAVEIIFKMFAADVLLCSGYSKQNVLAVRWAKILRKPSVYLMHGCVEHENTINGVPDDTMNRVERETLLRCDHIFAVSKKFADWLCVHYPEYIEKIRTLPNGIDWNTMQEYAVTAQRNDHQIISIGGGMPRKLIRIICEAVNQINQEKKMSLKLVIIGDTGLDTEEIHRYSFVEDLGIVPYSQVMELLSASKIFVQNSSFETFGLAPLEAMVCGCDVLMSDKVGATELFQELTDQDLIYDCLDSGEIAKKIWNLLQGGNNERLVQSIDKESTSWEARTEQLIRMLQSVIEKSL
ncbi:MAG: glycosyltransferase family 4 protein [Clostridia bacterium]|nr:glycosyltransferase family 4 protein [Clostridia bacterium]